MALRRVCGKSELAPGKVKRIEDPAIAVFNVEGTLFAISDTCTHAEASLSEGRVPVQTFRVLAQEDDIYVEIE